MGSQSHGLDLMRGRGGWCSCPLAAHAAWRGAPPLGELPSIPSAPSHVAAPPEHASRSGATATSTIKPGPLNANIISHRVITAGDHQSAHTHDLRSSAR